MPEQSILYKVLIALPSDSTEYLGLIQSSIINWNSEHGSLHNATLQPVNWKTDSTPEIGQHPQSILNRQLVDTCDILVAVFWSRLGTPTEYYLSGTAEEIAKFEAAGKPIKLYFSDEGVKPHKLDPDQLRKLQDFRKKYESKGLISEFSSQDAFKEQLHRHITNTIVEIQRKSNKNKNDIKNITDTIPTKANSGNLLTSESIAELLFKSINSLADRSKLVDNNPETFRSGFSDMDYAMAGSFRKGSIYSICGFPTCGKSSFLRSLVLNFIHAGLPCLVVSLQENAIDYTNCLLCMESGVEYHKFNSGFIPKRCLPQLSLAAGTLSSANIQIFANPALTIQEVLKEANELFCKLQKKPAIIIDDFYRLFINEHKKDPNLSYASFSSNLKSLANDLDTAIIGAYPLPLRKSGHADPCPNISDFHDAYPLWEFSSSIILLHPRPDVTTKTKDYLVEVISAKNQYGPIGMMHFGINIESHKFSEMTQDLKQVIDEAERASGFP